MRVLILLGVASLPWVRLNLSPSLPRGLYRLQPVPPTLIRGMLVLVEAPPVLRPWYRAWAPLLKPVAGVAGDLLTIHHDQHFYINDLDYGAVHWAAGGQILPLVEAPVRVPVGEVCLASPAPRSMDCRYSGTTPIADLRAMATPLWVW